MSNMDPEQQAAVADAKRQWLIVRDSSETCLMMVLMEKSTGFQFALGAARLMRRTSESDAQTFQAAILKQGMNRFANGRPFVLCGDFGSNPEESTREVFEMEAVGDYNLSMPEGAWPGFEAPKCHVCLRDAYRAHYTHPAPLTSCYLRQDQAAEGFTAVTASHDGIYVTPSIRVADVDQLPSIPDQARKESGGLIPSKEWFSDHYAVAAIFEVVNV